MICTICKVDSHPYIEMLPDGTHQTRCGASGCHAILSRESKEEPEDEPARMVAAEPARPRPGTNVDNIVNMLVARIEAIDQKLAEMDSLAKERVRLRAMLAAANPLEVKQCEDSDVCAVTVTRH